MLMVASAEVDVVAKMLCKSIDPESKASSINAYQEIITRAYPDLHQEKIEIPKHGLTLSPWSEWVEEKSPPLWWQDNNK